MATTIFGTPVVHGVAYAPALWATSLSIPEEWDTIPAPEERPKEIQRFVEATSCVAEDFLSRSAATSGDAAEVLAVSASIATDKGWIKDVSTRISDGYPTVRAIIDSTEHFVQLFRYTGGIMAERTTDLKDIRDRVIAELMGLPQPGIPHSTEPFILLAQDLTPTDAAALDPAICKAVVTQLGGPTSHTSIIVRQLGIPCIVAARRLPVVRGGEKILVDAHYGTVNLNVDEASALAEVERDLERQDRIATWQGPVCTRDHHAITVGANVGDPGAAQMAAQHPHVDGIGLLRTELAFLEAHAEPSVARQTEIYSQIFAAFSGSSVTVRTLDAGSDKPLPFVTVEGEKNPALGVRGLRITGPHPKVLDNQLTAIIAAAAQNPHTHVNVMAPMVSTVRETEWFCSLVRSIAAEAGVSLSVGIMVEVPSVVFLFEQFLPHVDFVSIGTNDLTQYTMAADRLSPDLAEYADPWQPALLASIERVGRLAKEAGVPVGVCGEAAADPLLSCVLVGMGVQSLSMSPGAIAGVGALLEQVTLQQCQDAAQIVLSALDPADARIRARAVLGVTQAQS